MLIFYLQGLILSVKCPPGTSYFYNQIVNRTTPKDSWFYFYTSHVNRKDRPLQFKITTNSTIKVFESDSTYCPGLDSTIIGVVNPGKAQVIDVPLLLEIRMCVIGVYAEEDYAAWELVPINQGSVKRFWTLTKKLLATLFVMISLVVGFFYYVTNPDYEIKEKND